MVNVGWGSGNYRMKLHLFQIPLHPLELSRAQLLTLVFAYV